MKVLIIANGVPDDSTIDGIFEIDQAKALQSIGVEVVFFGIDLRSIRSWRKFGVTRGVKDDVSWYKISLPLGRIPLQWHCKIGEKALLYLYDKVFKTKTPPDILHAHFTTPGWMSIALAKKLGIPIVITEHSSQIMKKPIKPSLLKVASYAYEEANEVITVSKTLSQKILKDLGVHSVIIPNIVDVSLFNSVKKVDHPGFGIAVVAGLVPGKRIDKLIEVVAELKNNIHDLKLHVIGGGPQRSQLEELAEELSVSNVVKFYGALPREDIASVFSLCDCFALLSAGETFGVAYVEAMAAGLPVVATRCGGPEGFVNSKNGLMVDIDNVKQAAYAIESIFKNKEIFDSEYIKKYVTDNFSPQSVAKQIYLIYEKVVNNEKQK